MGSASVSIRVIVRTEGEEVVLQVKDNGNGITPELLPRMFELFVQGEQSLARSEGGLGLGLALVKSLVEMHGGTVTAASEGLGLGGTFVVRLPVLSEAPPVLSPLQPRSEPERTRRVMLVDDNVAVVEDLANLLKHLGHDVRVAFDAPGALELAVGFHPEVVVADIGLPGMDGWELARRLRQLPALSKAKLIALSGYGQVEDVTRSRDAGFDLHLVKPVGIHVLQDLTVGD